MKTSSPTLDFLAAWIAAEPWHRDIAIAQMRGIDAPGRSDFRSCVEDEIERLVDLLDAIDGDPDDEFDTDLDVNPISLQAVDRVPAKRITMRRTA